MGAQSKHKGVLRVTLRGAHGGAATTYSVSGTSHMSPARDLPLDELMHTHADRFAYRREDLRFLLHGRELQPGDTPASTGLKDGDEVTVVDAASAHRERQRHLLSMNRLAAALAVAAPRRKARLTMDPLSVVLDFLAFCDVRLCQQVCTHWHLTAQRYALLEQLESGDAGCLCAATYGAVLGEAGERTLSLAQAEAREGAAGAAAWHGAGMRKELPRGDGAAGAAARYPFGARRPYFFTKAGGCAWMRTVVAHADDDGAGRPPPPAAGGECPWGPNDAEQRQPPRVAFLRRLASLRFADARDGARFEMTQPRSVVTYQWRAGKEKELVSRAVRHGPRCEGIVLRKTGRWAVVRWDPQASQGGAEVPTATIQALFGLAETLSWEELCEKVQRHPDSWRPAAGPAPRRATDQPQVRPAEKVDVIPVEWWDGDGQTTAELAAGAAAAGAGDAATPPTLRSGSAQGTAAAVRRAALRGAARGLAAGIGGAAAAEEEGGSGAGDDPPPAQRLPPEGSELFVAEAVSVPLRQMAVQLYRDNFSPDLFFVHPLLVFRQRRLGLDFSSVRSHVLFGKGAESGLAVGALSWRVHRSRVSGAAVVLEVLFIAVWEQYRNVEYGARLYAAVERAAREEGCPLAYVEIGREQPLAQQFWAKSGFGPMPQQEEDEDGAPPMPRALIENCCLRFRDTQQWVKRIS